MAAFALSRFGRSVRAPRRLRGIRRLGSLLYKATIRDWRDGVHSNGFLEYRARSDVVVLHINRRAPRRCLQMGPCNLATVDVLCLAAAGLQMESTMYMGEKESILYYVHY